MSPQSGTPGCTLSDSTVATRPMSAAGGRPGGALRRLAKHDRYLSWHTTSAVVAIAAVTVIAPGPAQRAPLTLDVVPDR